MIEPEVIVLKRILLILASSLLCGAVAFPQSRGGQEPPVIVRPPSRGNQEPPVITRGRPSTRSDKLEGILSKEQQEFYGMTRLTREERNRVADLLSSLAEESQRPMARQDPDPETESAARAIGWRSAEEILRANNWRDPEEWLRDSGWKRLEVAIIQSGLTDYLVVRTQLGTYATEDIPVLFPTLLFRDGYYWCRKGILEGIQSIIVRGRQYQFLVATWKPL